MKPLTPGKDAMRKPLRAASGGVKLRRFFRTKSGRRVDSRLYGYRCWPIGKSRKR